MGADGKRPRLVTGPARSDIRSTMRGIGLADTEVDAFMKAWDETLFGSSSGAEADAPPTVRVGTSFLYFLPEAIIERAARVTFDPPPRSFRWTQLQI